MQLSLNLEQLSAFLEGFHLLTGIRIAVFDAACREILAYPPGLEDFCALMHADPEQVKRCDACDSHAFSTCRKSGKLYVYQCHAGLTEAVCPLKDDGILIGYLMLGQAADAPGKQKLLERLEASGADEEIKEAARKLETKSREEILAAVKILEACTYYVLYHDLVTRRREPLATKMERYIEGHLENDLSAATISRAMGVSRTQLYACAGGAFGEGIAGTVRRLRLKKACELLMGTDLMIKEIAVQTGFSDYNYFTRVFRREIGCSPRAYRLERRRQKEKVPESGG